MKKKKFLSIFLITILSIIIILLGAIFIFINMTISSVKNLDISLTNNELNYSQIFDKNGNELQYSENLKDNYIKIENIPEYTKNAFISIEDKEFYNHNGLNYKRIIKATYNNLKSGNLVEGASTITQQLVKNRFLTNEKTFDRKIKEAYLSKKLEKQETKEKILETYLNTIYFGNGAYGIGNASKTFFNKLPQDLTLSESCVLAGCIKSPTNYSPLNNLDNSIKRRNLVLNEMLNDKVISNDQYNEAINEKIDISNSNVSNNLSEIDLYSQYVINEASEILNTNPYNVLHGGYKIITYQDDEIQKYLNKTINDEKNYNINKYGNIADSLSIIIDNKNYGVSAIAGKSIYNLVNFKRQPGSLIKPILVFAPAIEEGLINSKTQILDEEININGYAPKNVGNKYYGYISVEDIVAKSLNVPTIKIAQKLGLEKCKNYAELAGINFAKDDNGLAITLGGLTEGVTLKEITDSYSVLTNSGKYTKSNFIQKIENSNNMTIYNRKMSENNIYNNDTSYLMTDILKYSVKNGTSKKLSKFDYDIASKTGTVNVKNTNYNTDAYSLAYTTDHVMSVWLGNYSMKKEYNLEGNNNGGTYATQIICDTFEKIYNDEEPQSFVMPDSVENYIIDRKTLEEDHEIVLGDYVPERYQLNCLMSKRFATDTQSTKFTSIDKFDYQVETYKNSCSISFNAEDYITYNIYKISNGKSKKIDTVKSYNGTYSYTDTDILNNIKYAYYIEAKSNYSNAYYKTEPKYIFLEKNYNELIDSNVNDNLSWLFS